MKPFLESVADYIIGTFGTGMGELCVVFPNKRSGLFFKKFLSEKAVRTTWAPEITTINDFMCGLSHLAVADPLEVTFELYDIYKSIVPEPEPFDEFYIRGELMINDFDDIDKYLVDAGQLFSNITDLKEIDQLFGGLEEEQVKFIRLFWRNFHQGALTGEKKEFLTMWSFLPVLYNRLTSALVSRGIGYEGMIYRQVAENFPEDGISRIGNPKVIFAGFNALNRCEKVVFQHLRNSGKGLFFWDYDRQYVDEEYREAGKFIRENLSAFKAPVDLEDFQNMSRRKDIRIFDLPDDVLQAKMVTRLLGENERINFSDHTDTAVVLCDEELLVPVLMSLPEAVKEVNITMGYPFKNTPAFSFIDQLLTMQMNLLHQEQAGYYYKDVLGILNHPFVKSPDLSGDSGLANAIIGNNLIYIDEQDISGKLEKAIFRKVEKSEEFSGYLTGILEIILSGINSGEDDLRASLDREYLFRVLITLNRLDELIRGRKDLEVVTMIRMIKKILSGLRIPFSGEPLAGVQVMGILETRLLDFRNLILLSMNEEVMPRGQAGLSLIPYNLRAGYGMPSREDKDAIYATYFYRLIQRAERVDLIYNSNPEGVRSGEMSRYLYQLMFEYGLTPIRPSLNIRTFEEKAIVISKDPDMMEKLNRYRDPQSQSYLSPSALNTFLDCSLKYYFRYVAGISEKEEVSESVEPAEFGTIIHGAIKTLYEEIKDPATGGIHSGSLQNLLKNGRPERVLRDVFQLVFFKGRKNSVLSGRNIIIFRVMLKYVLKVIEKDIEIAPVRLESLEKFYSRGISPGGLPGPVDVRIGGKIDRIDRCMDRLRVIDYKTGSASLSISSVEDLFDGSLRDRNRAGFQTCLYAWLVTEAFPGEPVMPGLYVMKQLFSQDFTPGFTIGKGREKSALVSFCDIEGPFISHLRNTLNGLFSEEVPFSQTENQDICRYCDYNRICNRTC